MNIDLIAKEWFYRLPKGYADIPYTADELAVLNEVLDEYGIKFPSQQLDESKITQYTSFGDLLDIHNKRDKFDFFMENLPQGVVNSFWNVVSNEMTTSDREEFIHKLASESSVRAYSASEYTSGIGKKIFEIIGDNTVGRGEVFIAWLVDGARPQGPSKSYDIQIKDSKYEVKDYSKPQQQSKSIRLGTKGKVTQFKFWNEIISTIRQVDRLATTLQELNTVTSISDRLVEELEYFQTRGSEILSGKLSLTDQAHLTALYAELSELKIYDSDYTHVVVRGPYKEPVKLHIESIDLNNNYIKVTPIESESQLLTYVITELRRIRYVRDPALFNVDLQETVKQIVGTEIPFIIFRKNGAIVTNEFAFDTVDQGTVRIIEQANTRQNYAMEGGEEDEF
jgi:hypothetical protein